jgi:hypothetical protein
MILGRAIRIAKKAGWPINKIKEYSDKAREGDYNNLLKVFSDFYVRSYKLKKLSSLGAGFVIFGVICNFFFRLFFGV